MASVSGTFSMALMILSTYIKPYIGTGAFVLYVFIHFLIFIFGAGQKKPA